jgi:hypothetical protein
MIEPFTVVSLSDCMHLSFFLDRLLVNDLSSSEGCNAIPFLFDRRHFFITVTCAVSLLVAFFLALLLIDQMKNIARNIVSSYNNIS